MQVACNHFLGPRHRHRPQQRHPDPAGHSAEKNPLFCRLDQLSHNYFKAVPPIANRQARQGLRLAIRSVASPSPSPTSIAMGRKSRPVRGRGGEASHFVFVTEIPQHARQNGRNMANKVLQIPYVSDCFLFMINSCKYLIFCHILQWEYF